jgi:hypothetical protein
MMQDRSIRTLGSRGIGVTLGLTLLLGAMTACAGANTPARDDDLEEQIAVRFAGQVASAGGSGGSGALTSAGGSGAGQGTGGSTMAGGAGSGSVASGGGGGSSGCDGFGLITENCGGPNCHGAPQAGGLTNFALDETTAKALAGQQDPSPLCTDGGILFNPDNAASSLVIQKVRGTASCGARMPLSAPPLADADISCIETWIKTL